MPSSCVYLAEAVCSEAEFSFYIKRIKSDPSEFFYFSSIALLAPSLGGSECNVEINEIAIRKQ